MGPDDILKLLAVGEDADPTPDDKRVAALQALSRRMGTPPPSRDAPVREVVSRLGDNWSPLILKVLATGEYRHATLKRVVGKLSYEGEISQRMLTLRLKALERDGFVARDVHPSVPPRVTYRLTPLGRDLEAELDRLLYWIETKAADIEAARNRFRS